jgi:DNA-binding transcriptional regulator YdaS (Cro superfamily)
VDQTETLSPEQALVLAINRIGGQAAMARVLGIAQPTVWGWLNRSDKKELPAEHVLAVECATHVARHDLRPDLYPRGLQDDVPFRPGSELSETDGQVADETSDFLQRKDEWPIGGEPKRRPRDAKAAA